jgi:hypothetical protein
MINAVGALMLCVATAGTFANAQNPTNAGAKQTGGKGKAAPKAINELDDDFTPRVKTKEKTPGRSSTGNRSETQSEEIADPSGGGAPGRNSAPVPAPAAGPAANSEPSPPTINGSAKKPGVTRLCLATPRAQVSAGDAAQAAEGIRNTFKSYFTGPTMEVVVLAARLPAQAFEEARQGGCEFVLNSSFTLKKGGRGGGLLGRTLGDAANTAVWNVPGGGSTAGAVARSAAISGVYTAASIAGSIKAKDELTLEYKLQAADGERLLLAKTGKAKAKSDGEDVLTPLIENAADAVAAAMLKR